MGIGALASYRCLLAAKGATSNRIAIEAGGMTIALGGVDALVFTAGIGEHAPAIRAAICKRLAWLGIVLDCKANTSAETRISASGSKVALIVYPTDEEAIIAQHTQALLARELSEAHC